MELLGPMIKLALGLAAKSVSTPSALVIGAIITAASCSLIRKSCFLHLRLVFAHQSLLRSIRAHFELVSLGLVGRSILHLKYYAGFTP